MPFRIWVEYPGSIYHAMNRVIKDNFMKIQMSKSIQSFRAISLIILASLLLTVGCVSTADPLARWKPDGNSGYVDIGGSCQAYVKTIPYGKAISDDVLKFIEEMPVHKGRFKDISESYWIDNISIFKDGTGQRAVKIHFGLDGTYLDYVLIYNESNVRIKTVKFSSGEYRS
jgi:hypothetical protein